MSLDLKKLRAEHGTTGLLDRDVEALIDLCEAQAKWIDDVQIILDKTKEMTLRADEMVRSRGQQPSKFSAALVKAIALMQDKAKLERLK